MTASNTVLAQTALTAVPLLRALELAQWTGASRELTASGVLRPAVAVQACRELGIALPPGKLRSAKEVRELDQAWTVALAAGLIRVTASRAAAAPGAAELVAAASESGDPAEPDAGLAERIVLTWLRGAGALLGFPGEPCEPCVLVLHELRVANGPVERTDLVAAALAAVAGGPPADPDSPDDGSLCPDCGQPHDASDPDLDEDRLDLADHAMSTTRALVDLAAAATGPGRSAGGTVVLTPLGRVLADSVLGTLSPPADVAAAVLVAAVAQLPPKLGLIAAGPWLAARTRQAAARELLEFAAAFDGPVLRLVALEIARRQGDAAMPAWRDYARVPGFGAYARQWLAARHEPVTADDRDEAWLLVDTIVQSAGSVGPGLLPLLGGAVTMAAGNSAAEVLTGIANCGHPHAADVTGMLSGGSAPGFGNALEAGTLYQLKITLRDVSKPPVWRRVLVPAEASLGELHAVVVRAMGWAGGHLHVFSDDISRYGIPDPDLGFADEDAFALADLLFDPGDKLRYTYDLGDGWQHDIRLEKVLSPDAAAATAPPACLAGRGACPPEDCGGPWGYASLKETIADPADPEHGHMLKWLGLDDRSDFDPAAFDLADVNARLR